DIFELCILLNLDSTRSKVKLIKHLAETRKQSQNHMQETDIHSIDTPIGEPSEQTNEPSLITEFISSPASETSSNKEIREKRSNKRQKNTKMKETEIRKLLKEI
ncbi:16067_t:CDS:1, partial [Racocetra persica]